jgi:2-polyprenyl-3-methyl-5-hydroxy-6-metoxy-1,4-benzoquinol methylase/RimJ/RimL family protein N-acetyltransferase
MDTSKICRHPIGFLEFSDKPTKEELRTYYADRYFQTSQGNYRSAYGPVELIYSDNKLAQRVQIIDGLLTGRIGSMLDVGCGEGFAMAHFQRLGWTVTGLDYSQAGVAAMNPHCLPLLTTGDIDTLLKQIGQSGRKFDLIWLSNVLEHVIDPVDLMSQIRKLLSDGGVLVIIVPNDFSPVQTQLVQQGHISEQFWITPPDHLSYFDNYSLRALGVATGYRCLNVIADFPIDWFLYHPGSNYVADRSLGPAAHRARVQLENLLANKPIHQINQFYEVMAGLGFGRQLTAFFSINGKTTYSYACLRRQRISYRGYTIRPVQLSDIEFIRQWRNAQMDVLRQKNEISAIEQFSYYEKRVWPTMTDPHPPQLLLAYLINDELIGYGGLVHIDWENRRAEVSFLVDPIRTTDVQVYAQDFSAFLQLIKTLAFDDLRLRRLFTETYATRKFHISVLESSGFALEGVLQQQVIIDDRPIDSLIHGCLKDSYAK